METKAIRLWEQDYPTSLSGGQWKDPLTVFDQFFSCYTVQEAQLWLSGALPLVFTHQIVLSPGQRYRYLCLVNRLEQLVDAAYVLTIYPDRAGDRNAPGDIRSFIGLNFLSFLSEQEALKPLRTMRIVFSIAGPKNWKPGLLHDLRCALFDPSFYMTGNSGELREFDDYLGLNKLLEAAFLLSHDHRLPEESSLHWSLQECQPSPLAWGTQFYAEAGIKQALESLAFINYYRRWCIDWHASAGLLFIQHYQTLHLLIYLAEWVSNISGIQQQEDHTLMQIRQALRKQFVRNPAGYYARFLHISLLNVVRDNLKAGATPSGNRKIKQIEIILHLSSDYFIQLRNRYHHE